MTLPRESSTPPELAAEIDATDEIERRMTDAALELVMEYGYSLSDLVGVLEVVLEVDDG